MHLNAESVTVGSDEGSFTLEVFGYGGPDQDEVSLTIDIHGIDLDTFYDQVRGRIGPHLREKHEAAVAHGAQKRAEYDREVYDHERMTGQHAPFLCAVEDIDESGGYDVSDPKHPDFHSVHVDLYDQREGK